jgi:hypothetical protein
MAPLRQFPWHPLLLPVVFILGFHLATAAPVDWLIRPLLIGVGLSAILYAVCRLALRDWHMAALAASGLFLVLAGLGWYPLFLGAAAAVLGLYPPLKRRRREWLPWLHRRSVNRALDTVTGVLVAILIVQGLPHLAWPTRAAESLHALADAGPNIQIIILDGYARADTLAEWGFDNTPFLASLESRGFDVSERARSSYRSTPLVIASLLRMAHVPDFPVDPPADELGQARLLRLMSEDVPALSALSQAGYEIRVVDGGIEQTRIGPAHDVEGREYPTTLELALLQKTMAAGLVDIVAPDLLPGMHRSRVEAGLQSLAGTGDRPRFTIAHFVTPHPPFIYAADGSLPDQPACFPATCSFYGASSTELSLTNEEFQGWYTEQIAGLNTVVLEALDAVLAADPDAVIVLMSDHGSRFDGQTAPLEPYRPLFAARTPGHPNLFGDEPSNTQGLAVLLNAYLDGDVPVPTTQRFEEYGPLDVSPIESGD